MITLGGITCAVLGFVAGGICADLFGGRVALGVGLIAVVASLVVFGSALGFK